MAQLDDKGKVNMLLEQSREMLLANRLDTARILSEEALAISKIRQWVEEEAKSYLILADLSFQQQEYTEALSYAVQASAKFELSDNIYHKILAYRLLTEIYDRADIYQRAIVFGEKLEKMYLPDSANTLSLADLRYAMSQRHFQLQEYEQAENYAYAALEVYQKILDTPELTKVHELLIKILQNHEKYEQAVPHALWLNNIYGLEKQDDKKVTGLNNLGFLYQRIGEKRKALEAFNEAVRLSEKITQDASSTLLINLGLAYSNLGQDKQAIKYYQLALEKQQKKQDKAGEAELYNYLSSHYFLSGRQSKALETAEKASQIALEQQDLSLLTDNYLLLKLIYQKEEHWEKVEEYDSKLKQVEQQIQQKNEVAQQQQQRIEQMAELHEEEIRIAWNEKEKVALEKERKETQIKFQQQELALLKKQKELQSLALEKQKLESRNARQALSIVQQQLMAEKQENELQALTRSKELQELKIKKQYLEQQKQQQTIELLEADQKLKQQKLQQEARMRKYSMGILVLCVLIILVIAFFFILKSKDNRMLKRQKKEISNKNELLSQSEQELKEHLRFLEEARHLLAEQKGQLMAVHNRVQESIEYAKHIQSSILPDDFYLKTLFPESCVIFMPKDVVSGDFYWVSHHQNYQVIIVADCTGHGVPGALITLIGHGLLTEAIQVHRMTEPDSILYFLHQRIQDRFQNKDSTRQHGMDMGICIIHKVEKDVYELNYAGAKNSLWLVKNGEFSRFKGDRCSIGGIGREISFTCHHAQLRTRDAFYLSSDGFIDQPNPGRRRLGSGKLTSCIEEWHQLPMQEQEQKFLTFFHEHKQEAELRDDVTLIGIRL